MQPPRRELYTASCNPPRQARPQATLAVDNFSDEVNVDDETEEEPELPLPTPPGPRKRGRKPAIASRSAREAQRKLNHSIIEKARRTRINEALAQLRHLVPEDYDKSCRDSKSKRVEGPPVEEGEEGDCDASKLKARSNREREFKLEILVKTVDYLEYLTDRVKLLEASQKCQCQIGAPSLGSKRKRQDCEDASISARPKLPPISSWLTNESTSSRSPDDISARDTAPTCLPSPPSSTQFQPVTALQMPPTLSLDPPSPSGGMYSPALRSREESAVVSLLVNMSSAKSNSTGRTRRSSGGSDHHPETVRHRLAQTPASILGIY